MYCIASTVSPCPLPSRRLLHVCRCVTSGDKRSGNPKDAPRRWSSPLPPAPLPLLLTHLPSLAAPVGRPTTALLPSTLPRERQWAIPRLRSTFPPLLRRLWAIPRPQSSPPPFPSSACGRSHGCTPSPSLPLRRRWAIPRLHSPPRPPNPPHYTAGRVVERSTP